MPALEITQAQKFYKTVEALRGIDLSVAQGEFFGLLGPNGAGKTTLIQCIVGLCRLSGGKISVFGKDVVRDYLGVRRLVGYSPQEVNLDRFFSIRKILEYQAGFFGASRVQQKALVERLLVQFRLSEKSDAPYYKLSGGMQKRVLICKALVSEPKLLILDEPTAGVDVEQRHELWDYLRKLNQDGTTIILTTHYIDEAEALCERIGIINLGKVCELGSPQALIQKYCKPTVKITANHPVNSAWFTGSDFNDLHVHGAEVSATAARSAGPRAGLLTQHMLEVILKQDKMRVDDISVNKGSLEDVFLKVTGEKLL